MNVALDRQISYDDTSASTRARKRFAQTGERTSVYACLPERESYEATRVFERPDGTRYKTTTPVYTWAGSVAYGTPVVTEIERGE